MLCSEPTLLEREELSPYLFKLCVLEPDGGGPGGGPGRGMPGFQLLPGDAFRGGPSCGTAEPSPVPCESKWPVDAALFAAGGLGSAELGTLPA